ncbi:MAG: S41 family peptidase [Planctomycetota bacterium]|jgi:carboxyl-terminal processing protease
MRLSFRNLALLAVTLVACQATGPQALEEESVRLELGRRVVATLDRQEHYFSEQAAREAFGTRLDRIARDTGDAEAYYRALADALATLDEGHTGLVGSAKTPFSDTIPPVALLELPEGPVVAGVAPGIESGGLKPGDLILTVENRPVRKELEMRLAQTAGSTPHGRRARAVAHLLAGPTGQPGRVTVRDLEGRVRVCFPLRFLLDDEGRYRQRFGFLPDQIRVQRIDAATAYVSLPDFEPGRGKEFLDSLESLRALPILVLDLRGNPGGRIHTLQEIAGIFFEEPVPLLRMRLGEREEVVKSTPQPYHYRGNVRILVDGRTGSAAELLAAALRDRRSARIVGRPTAGSTRSRRTARLPGGVLFHYAGRAEFLRLDGRPVEGVGVPPDVVYLPSRGDLAQGHYGDAAADPAVRRALDSN